MPDFDIIIIGAGASGMSAAIEAKNNGCKSILLIDSRDYLGGVLPQCIHDGFTDGKTGPEYSEGLENCIKNAAEITVMLSTSCVKINDDKTAVLSTKSGILSAQFKELILATGCTEKTLSNINIFGARCNGIFYAGQAQEMINIMHKNIGDDAVIIGCGDLGMIMARRLTLCGKKVVAVIEKNSTYGGMARNYHECIEKYNIPVLYNTTVKTINGDKNVSSVTLNNNEKIACKTVIVSAGLLCENSLVSHFEKLPEWISLCGNCCEVFSMVESAVNQSKKAAKIIAQRI